MSTNDFNTLIIVPAYNEEASIQKTVESIKNNVPEFDYIVINDCSTDRTKEICQKEHYNVLNLPVNLGIGGAVQTGYIYGYENGYDYAVQIDGDGQHDPAFLVKMQEEMMRQNANMIIGSRFIEKEGFQSSMSRRFGIRFFECLIRLMTGVTIKDSTSGLRMIDREVMRIFSVDYPRDYPEPESVVSLIKRKKIVVEMPVIMKERTGGVSSISIKKAIYYMFKVTIAIIIECFRKY